MDSSVDILIRFFLNTILLSKTGSPISHPQLSSTSTPPISVANEIILPHGTIIDRGMITQ